MMAATDSLRATFPHLAEGRGAIFAGLAEAVRPRRRRSVAQWAAEERWVSQESGSPYALGRDVRWVHEHAPHMVEVMECLSLSHPSFEVSVMASAQVVKTEAGVNLVGQIIDEDPSPILVLLPSLDEQKKYVRVKLQPTIEATPALRAKVREQKARDEDGSTSAMKRFRGGYAVIATASSSKALQMVSYRVVVGEEISEWPFDAGGRGDPLDQAIARTKAYRETKGAKAYWNSTPGTKGTCRISAKFEAGDQRRRYVPCPHCGAYQVLRFPNMRFEAEKPYGAHFVCIANGCVIEAEHKSWCLDRGVWLKTYPAEPDSGDEAPGDVVLPEQLERFRARGSAGREPSFHVWQAYSKALSWDATAAEYLASRGKPEKEKTFCQQGLGEAWEDKGDAPDAERLVALVEDYDSRRLPPGALMITGFSDVQGYGLKWCIYAWGAKFECWRIDGGTIEGDPTDDRVWSRLAEIVRRKYVDDLGQAWPIDGFGVDSGYLSPRVYKFCRDMRRAGFERIFATDGRGGERNAMAPAFGVPRKVSITWRGKREGSVLLWPLGTWPLKLECYGALNRRLLAADHALDPEGQPWTGLPHFNHDCDLAFFRELTAEYLFVGERQGRPFREWRTSGTNDRLDCWVGARGLASHLVNETGATDDVWQALAQQRRPAADPQGDLLAPVLPGRVKVATTPALVGLPTAADAGQDRAVTLANAVRANVIHAREVRDQRTSLIDQLA